MLRESLDWFLEKVAGIKVNRLPSECFARYMLVKACGFAPYQIAFKRVDNCSDMTLHSDGTSKKGQSYSTFDDALCVWFTGSWSC